MKDKFETRNVNISTINRSSFQWPRKQSLREFDFAFFPIRRVEKGWVAFNKRLFLHWFWFLKTFSCCQGWKWNSIKRKLHNWAIKRKDNKRRKSCLMTLDEIISLHLSLDIKRLHCNRWKRDELMAEVREEKFYWHKWKNKLNFPWTIVLIRASSKKVSP